MFSFTRLSLARQFLIVSFIVLFSGMLFLGAWVGRQIEIGVVHRTAAVTALYVDSLVSHHLRDLILTGTASESHKAEIDALLTDTPLGQRVVAFKVWGADGRILYSTNPTLIGLQFPIESGLKKAFDGDVHTEISDLEKEENMYEQEAWPQLIETYAPVRFEDKVVAVIEFYQTMDDLKGEIQAAQQRSWVVVGVATIVVYLLLAGLVGRASNTILAQQGELQKKVTQLSGLLEQNRQLHNRVSRAAARAAALNERFLLRISADLHDGPGQDLGLALLRIGDLADTCATCRARITQDSSISEDFRTVQSALQSALMDLRAILAGLRLPQIEDLSLAETVERAVREYERKTARAVPLTMRDIPAEAPLSVKITLYRILQESLSNGFRHAKDANQRVDLDCSGGPLIAEIADDGAGFDPLAVHTDEHLGLVGMRERVEILGGTFSVESAPGRGTTIRVLLPLAILEAEDE